MKLIFFEFKKLDFIYNLIKISIFYKSYNSISFVQIMSAYKVFQPTFRRLKFLLWWEFACFESDHSTFNLIALLEIVFDPLKNFALHLFISNFSPSPLFSINTVFTPSYNVFLRNSIISTNVCICLSFLIHLHDIDFLESFVRTIRTSLDIWILNVWYC